MVVARFTLVTALLAHAAIAYHVEDDRIIYREHDPVQRIFPIRYPLPKDSQPTSTDHQPRRAGPFATSVVGQVDPAFAFPISTTDLPTATLDPTSGGTAIPQESVVGLVNGAMLAFVTEPPVPVDAIVPRLMPLETNSVLGPVDPDFATNPLSNTVPAPAPVEQEQRQIDVAGANKLGRRRERKLWGSPRRKGPVHADGILEDALTDAEKLEMETTLKQMKAKKKALQGAGKKQEKADKEEAKNYDRRCVPVGSDKVSCATHAAVSQPARRHVIVDEQEDGSLRVAANKPQRRCAPVHSEEGHCPSSAAVSQHSQHHITTASQLNHRAVPVMQGEDGDLVVAANKAARRDLTRTYAVIPTQTITVGGTTFASSYRPDGRYVFTTTLQAVQFTQTYGDLTRGPDGLLTRLPPTSVGFATAPAPPPASSTTSSTSSSSDLADAASELGPLRFSTMPHNVELFPPWTTVHSVITQLDGNTVSQTFTVISPLEERDHDHGKGWQTEHYVAASGTEPGLVAPTVTPTALSQRDEDHGRGWQTEHYVAASGTEPGLVAPTATPNALSQRDKDHGKGWQMQHHVQASGTEFGPVAPAMTADMFKREENHGPGWQTEHYVAPSGTDIGPVSQTHYVSPSGTEIGPVSPTHYVPASGTEIGPVAPTSSQIIFIRDEDHGSGWQTSHYVAASGTEPGPVAPTPAQTLSARDEDHGPGWQTQHYVAASGTEPGPVSATPTQPLSGRDQSLRARCETYTMMVPNRHQTAVGLHAPLLLHPITNTKCTEDLGSDKQQTTSHVTPSATSTATVPTTMVKRVREHDHDSDGEEATSAVHDAMATTVNQPDNGAVEDFMPPAARV